MMTAPLIIRDIHPAPDEHDVVVMLNDFTTRDPADILAALRAPGKKSAGGMKGISAERRRARAGWRRRRGPDRRPVRRVPRQPPPALRSRRDPRGAFGQPCGCA